MMMVEIISFKLNKNSNMITTLLDKGEPTDLVSHYNFCLALNREDLGVGAW